MLAILFLLFTISCSSVYDVPSTYEVKILVTYPDNFNDGAPISNTQVKVLNIQTGRLYQSTTNESGYAELNVRGGNYDMQVSFSENHNVEVDGYPTRKTVLFNGSLNGQLITKNNETFTIQTESSYESEGFIFKEIYVSGSRTPEEKAYGADKFIEIYNNSDKLLYADGLCLGMVYPITTERPTTFTDDDGNLLDRCPVWSFIPIIPGSGTDYPVQPGESVIIALSALNHRDDPNGNPNSIDLSIADWEMYSENSIYIDIPSVPNLLMQKITTGSTISLSVRGQVSILFRLPSNDFESIFTNSDNYLVEPGGVKNCFMVPWSWIIDGVENARLDDDGVFKRLKPSIDIGYIQFRGSYEGVSIRRKVKEVINGRIVYQDTNNSSEDFLTNLEPNPGVIAVN
jgi:hypothetical protein